MMVMIGDYLHRKGKAEVVVVVPGADVSSPLLFPLGYYCPRNFAYFPHKQKVLNGCYISYVSYLFFFFFIFFSFN